MPSFTEEMILESRGCRCIAGIDEAGRGALAGPVVAAAVVLPCGTDIPFIDRVQDSKKLTPRQRESLYDCIRETAVSYGIGLIEYDIIDKVGILEATRMAMKMAVSNLSPAADALLIDYVKLPDIPLPQKGITHGDDLCYSIAWASIIAKVYRDRLMVKLDSEYSGYGLAKHKGYGTRLHLESLRQLGPSPIHRMSFYPVTQLRFRTMR
jgi:ribonuclease HII